MGKQKDPEQPKPLEVVDSADQEFEHVVLPNIPSSTEGITSLLNGYGKKGYVYYGMLYDNIIMVREKRL